MYEPVFAPVTDEDLPSLLKISETAPGLCDIYTSLKVTGSEPYIGTLWCGKINGEIREVIYENGSYIIHHTEKGTAVYPDDGDIFSIGTKANNGLCLMIYRGSVPDCRKDVVRLEGKRVREIYRLAKGVDILSENTEKRCLYSIICSNKGFAGSFGIFEGAELMSTASVVGINKKYALIGNVFTKAGCRGRGLASDVVSAVVRRAIENQLIPVLICEKRLSVFYEKSGFEIISGGE